MNFEQDAKTSFWKKKMCNRVKLKQYLITSTCNSKLLNLENRGHLNIWIYLTFLEYSARIKKAFHPQKFTHYKKLATLQLTNMPATACKTCKGLSNMEKTIGRVDYIMMNSPVQHKFFVQNKTNWQHKNWYYNKNWK